ncbi:MAG: hypothetical protein AAGF97_16605, partial [Planctomycetota bacterium]
MARIVFISCGMSSTLNASLEASRRLRAEGHEILFMSQADLHDVMQAHDLAFVQLSRCDAIRRECAERVHRAGPRYSLGGLRQRSAIRRECRQRSVTDREIEEQLAAFRPALLIIDSEMHYAILAALPLGIPIALSSVWFSYFRSPGLPPMHTRLLPAGSWFEHLRIHFAWWKLNLARQEPTDGIVAQPRENE